VFCPGNSLTKSCEFLEDGISGGGPHEGLCILVVRADEAVFGIAGDPVQAGLVASLSRPGGNLTGVTTLSAECGGLWLFHAFTPRTSSTAGRRPLAGRSRNRCGHAMRVSDNCVPGTIFCRNCSVSCVSQSGEAGCGAGSHT
jgi:hypothetical protein